MTTESIVVFFDGALLAFLTMLAILILKLGRARELALFFLLIGILQVTGTFLVRWVAYRLGFGSADSILWRPLSVGMGCAFAVYGAAQFFVSRAPPAENLGRVSAANPPSSSDDLPAGPTS